jgi:hypothetical protein
MREMWSFDPGDEVLWASLKRALRRHGQWEKFQKICRVFRDG